MDIRSKCQRCKRSVKNPHDCSQCEKCSRYFTRLANHKCLYRVCTLCDRSVRITSKHVCNVPLKCGKCDYTTLDRLEMAEHRKAGHIYKCPDCDFESRLMKITKQHYHRRHKLGDSFDCPYCSLIFNKRDRLQNHILTQHVSTDLPISECAFKKSCISYGTRFQNGKNAPLSIDSLFSKYSPQIKAIFTAGISSYASFKASVIIFAKLSKYDHLSISPIETVEFINQSMSYSITRLSTDSDLERHLSDIQSHAEQRFDSYCDLEGSGWTFEYVSGLFVQLGACKSLTGGCFQDNDFKSDFIWDGKCEDGECFYTSISRHYHSRGTSDEVINNFARTAFKECGRLQHMSVTEIAKFEQRYDISINVITKEETGIYTIYTTKREGDNAINLLLLQLKDGRHHYVYVTDIAGLINEIRYLSSNYSDNSAISSNKHVYPCLNCLNIFTCKQALCNHKISCFANKSQRIIMPDKNEVMEFSRFEARYKAPLIGAFDFESKMSKDDLETLPNSMDIATHKIISYSFVIISSEKEIIFERTQVDENDCLQLFMEAVMDASRLIGSIMERITPMELTREEEEYFKNTGICHICALEVPRPDKVRDHCHFTGQFIGPAHASCNLKRRRSYKIPIYAHNFSNYDAHFLLQAIVNYKDYIPNLNAMCFNSQKFRSISLDMFNFLDSMQFISDSLHNISSQLNTSNWDYKILRNSGIYATELQRELLLKKGVFPYELMTSLAKFKKLRTFPNKDAFYSTLYEKGISDEEYIHGRTVFKEFDCANMAEYLKLYNKLDVILLLEAITSFREMGWREFKLDPAYFISLPQYGFQW